MNKIMGNRFSHIDLMECVAIFFVVFYHSTFYSFDFMSDGTATNYLLYFSRSLLATCVPIFFFVNGYLLFGKPLDMKKHVKKTIRLVVLIGVWALILMPLYLLIEGEPVSLNSIIVPVLNLSTDWGMNLFWYIGALVCIYILFPLLKTAFDKNRAGFVSFTIACALVTVVFNFGNEIVKLAGCFTHTLENGLEMPVITMFNPFVGAHGYSFVYFCVGGLLGEGENFILKMPRLKRNVISAFGILVSCGIWTMIAVLHSKYIHGSVWDLVWNGYGTVFTFLNVIFIYALSLNMKRDVALIRETSKNTLGIYFIHGLILRLSVGFVKDLCNGNFFVNILYALAVLSVCLVICMILKKIPIVKKLI